MTDSNLARLASGLLVPLPSSSDWRTAEKITRKQEKLYNRALRLTGSEEDQAAWLTLQRRVADLEMMKHPLLRVWNIHLAPRPPIRGLHVAPDFLKH